MRPIVSLELLAWPVGVILDYLRAGVAAGRDLRGPKSIREPSGSVKTIGSKTRAN